VIGLSAALVGGNLYFLDRVDTLQNEILTLRAAVKNELTTLNTDAITRSQQQQQLLSELKIQLEQSGARSFAAASQASVVAKRYSDALAKRLEDQQAVTTQSHEDLVSQLGEMKRSTEQQVSGIVTDVSSVKGEVTQARSQLDKTISDLKTVRGDLGIQSGLIATNAQELAALRALGDREYYEFELMKTKSPQKVGEVAVQLKKWDAKRNRYTIELIANDKRVEKKDRTVNEPVQFYMAKARLPYEFVVNEVRKDSIVGYLAAPKMREVR
jgi:hypothetical protein